MLKCTLNDRGLLIQTRRTSIRLLLHFTCIRSMRPCSEIQTAEDLSLNGHMLVTANQLHGTPRATRTGADGALRIEEGSRVSRVGVIAYIEKKCSHCGRTRAFKYSVQHVCTCTAREEIASLSYS